jgi:hypothetical protein
MLQMTGKTAYVENNYNLIKTSPTVKKLKKHLA